MSEHPSYLRVFLTFARNSLVRDMTFRTNFLVDVVASLTWVSMQLAFYLLIFAFAPSIGSDWGKYEFLVFLATTLLANSLVGAFFMPNLSEFSELIRTGHLDFALLKPIDTQFLVSFQRIEWSTLANFVFALCLLAFALVHLENPPQAIQWVLFIVYVGCGVAMLYSLMIALSSASVWMGRNQNLYDFWFYITNFSRYPMEIYEGPIGTPLRRAFTFVVPILVVVNVPARMLAQPLSAQNWPLAGFAILATAGSLLGSRWMFVRALASYRSASS
ncbi:MAG: ABC-2 family transporter protein [Planctomycetia bacterium]|nr:ABC-2 family transporter protein [Planctomycetia bacterium]